MDTTAPTIAPYPGLRPYDSEEANIFFGREQQTDELLAKLQTHRFIAVTGPSGCGKSSLIKAGLIPALRAGFMLAAGSRWRFCTIRPGQHPISSLAAALATPDVLGEDHEPLGFIDAALRFGPLGLTQIVKESGEFQSGSLLVLVDQFEEIFRFRERIDPDEADAFVRLLLTSAAAPDVPIYVVITMRSDYLGDCALFHGLPEAINAGQYLTPRLTREQCGAAIVGPARVCGGDVDPVLVNRLLNDFGPDPDQLPLLQHALMRMWGRTRKPASDGTERVTLRVDDYEAVGGLAHALARHADEALAELSEPRRLLAEIMFRRLTERGTGRRDTRAPARICEVAGIANVPIDEVTTVAAVFRGDDRHFVTAPDDPLKEDTLLDIGHESLIRQWGTLAGWVDAEAESATTYKRVVDFARLWKKKAAGLWRPPELELARAWLDDQQPNAAWAARYSSKELFDTAMAFLKASQQEWEAEQTRVAAREEEERRRERERIEQEAQRGRLEALAKAAQAEAELERTKAVAERQSRRNRVLRAATVLLSASMVALIGAILVYRYLWVWEHADYYNAYVKKHGVPTGIGDPLIASQVRHREQSFKIVRRGAAPGSRVVRMESVDGTGRFARRGGAAAGYLGDSDGDNGEGHTVQWEYVYDNKEKDHLAYDIELDARGRQVSSMVYMLGGANPNQRTAHFFGPNGEEVALSESCAEYLQIEYSEAGYESHLRYMDRLGKTAPGRDHALQLETNYDKNGNAIELISLDAGGQRMNDRYGNAVAKTRYDTMGNPIEQMLLDRNGSPVVGIDGWSIDRQKYDENGNLIETSVFDETGKPTLNTSRWHRYTRTLDDNGHSVREQNWGINGEPIAPKGCHEYRTTYDSLGRGQTTDCLGLDGRPSNETSNRVSRWTRAYDGDDNVTEWAYFDPQGRPVNNLDNYHKELVKFDDRGHVVQFVFEGVDGKRVNRADGYASLDITLDGDKEIKRVYLDADGKLAAGPAYTERRREYDASGNLVLQSFYDAAGNPKDQSGYVAAKRVYDQCGQVLEEWYLKEGGRPRATVKQGDYAAIRYGRDPLGRVTRWTYLSEQGRPTLVAGKYATVAHKLDARERVLEESYFDADDHPVLRDGEYATIRSTFNREGQKIAEEFLGVDGRPAKRPVTRLVHAYNADGQLVENKHYPTGSETPIGIERYTYDGDGRKVEEAYFGPDEHPFLRGTDYGDCIRVRFTYDEAGKITRTMCADLNNKWSPAKKQSN